MKFLTCFANRVCVFVFSSFGFAYSNHLFTAGKAGVLVEHVLLQNTVRLDREHV